MSRVLILKSHVCPSLKISHQKSPCPMHLDYVRPSFEISRAHACTLITYNYFKLVLFRHGVDSTHAPNRAGASYTKGHHTQSAES